MPVTLVAEPGGGRELVHASLAQRVRSARHSRALCGTPQSVAALPVYRLTLRAASGPTPLRKARKVGWRYPIIGGDTPGLVHLLRGRKGLIYGGFSEGPAAQRLLDAAMLAEEQLSSLPGVYQARILEIPSLRLHALWLYARRGTSRFVPLTDEPYSAAGIRLQLVSELQTRIDTGLAQATRRVRKD